MIRKFLSGAAMVIALAAPAWAQDQCAVPKSPAIPDGAKATPNQIVAAQDDIKAFAAASENYQSCMARELARQKALATQNDPGLQTALQGKSDAQRKDVERVVASWSATVEAFNKAQERKPRRPASTPSAPGGGGYGGGGYGGGTRY